MDLGGLIQAGNGQSPTDNNGFEGDPGSNVENNLQAMNIDPSLLSNIAQGNFQFYYDYNNGPPVFDPGNFGTGANVNPNDLFNNLNMGGVGDKLNDGMKNYSDSTPFMDKMKDKFDQLVHKYDSPEKAFNEVFKDLTGYDRSSGKFDWKDAAMNVLGKAFPPLAILQFGNKLANFFDIKTPFNQLSDINDINDAYAKAPDATNNIDPNALDPSHINNNEYFPIYNEDGSVKGISVVQGNNAFTVTPDELKSKGLTPDDLLNMDWNGGNSITVTSPPNPDIPITPPVNQFNPATPNIDITLPDVNIEKQGVDPVGTVPKDTHNDPGQVPGGGAGGGNGSPITPTTPETPPAHPIEKVFKFYDMPGFQMLSPDFGKEGPKPQ